MIVATYCLENLERKEVPLAHHKAGLTYTATGYGRKIPTVHMVKLPGLPR